MRPKKTNTKSKVQLDGTEDFDDEIDICNFLFSIQKQNKQNKTKQNKTNKTKQNKTQTKQNKTKHKQKKKKTQKKTKQNKTKQNKVEKQREKVSLDVNESDEGSLNQILKNM